ncbi:MAG TPA: PAS domain S-box protein [Spirochaetota bacterium]|nr:PAS domain S-box protein [Spirochaetota bacterium]
MIKSKFPVPGRVVIETRILIVEDETVIAMHLEKVLEKLGYRVCGWVTTGEAAVEKAGELRPTLILMDIFLSGDMDGIDAAKIIRDTLSIPVIYITGNADFPTIARARETEPYGYILKPVNTLHLFSMIDTALHRHELESRLVENEAKYRLLTDMMSDIIWMMDLDMKTTYVSPSVEKMLGFTPEERYAQKVEDQLTPASLALAQKTLADELSRISSDKSNTERILTLEVEYLHKNGSAVWFENKMQWIRDRDGKIAGIHGVSRNISDRKNAEDTLRERESRYRALFNQSPAGVVIYDLNLVIIECNEQFANMIRMTRDQLIGTDVKTIKEVEATFIPKLREAIEKGTPTYWEGEYELSGNKGRVYQSGNYNPLRNAKGELIGAIGIGIDLTERKRAEETLKKTEERFRTLVENLQDIILIMDENGTVTFENPVTRSTLGYSIMGTNGFEIIHPDDIGRVINDFGETIRSVNPHVPTSFRVKAGDGSWVHLAALAQNMMDDSAIRGILVVCHDITRSLKAENALRESEQRYQALFHQSPVGVFMFDTGLLLTECNERFAQIMRTGRDRIIGTDLNLLRHSEMIEYLKQTLLGKDTSYEGPYSLSHEDMMLWVNVTGSPLRDEHGNVIGGMGVIQDMTDRYVAQEKLQLSEERNRMLVENANEGIAVLQDRRFVFVNPRFTGITGYAAEDLASRDFTEFVYTDDREMMLGRYKKRMNGDTQPFIYEARLLDPEGNIRWAEFNSVLFAWGGRPAVLLFMRDIDERKRAEQERSKMESHIQQTQKLESLGVLAGGIAHDFNNLLMAILGNVDIAMAELPPSSRQYTALQEAAKASHRAAELCRQMLAYSGRGRFKVEVIDLNELIGDMVHMLEISVSKKAVLKYDFSAGIRLIEADATQVRQIIMNLVINASDAIGDSSGEITLSTGMMKCGKDYFSDIWLVEPLAEGEYVYLEVADTGCGMDPEMISKIFDPFFTTKFTGRGLGLAAVLGIVRGHGGAIKVFSEKGLGSAFRILFPATEHGARTVRSREPVKRDWTGSGTVLLVDDEENVRAVGGRMLSMLGFTVISASNGREAVDLFRAHAGEIACVIMDLTMPLMDGEEAFRSIREIRKGARVIISSGYSEQEIIVRFIGEGPSGFIQKPYQLDDLAAKLKEVLG